MGKKFNLEGVVPVNELGEAIEKPKLNLAGVIPVDEKGNEVKKKDQPSQLTQQPSINTSSSASGQSGQSSGQEGSALAILRKYAELSQTPGTAEYKMRQNEIARQKAAPQPLVEEKPVFDITQVDLPEMAQSSTVVTQKQAPSSVEELEKLKKQQEKYYAKAETAASATLYSKTGSVKKSDQYNWLYNASEDEREDFKNTLKSEGYGDKAIEQIFSKADTQAVSNLGQNKSSEFQDSIIKEMAPLKGVLSDAEFNKAFQDRISNKSLEYGIDQLDAYDKESYPIIKEWWDINNKLKDPNFTGPQRDKAIQTAIDLNSKLKSIREGQGDLINPLTGQQDKVYTDKVKQEEGSFASQSFDNLLNVRQQRMFELMAAEENYKNARKQHANIQLNSQNIPYSEYSKLLEASQKEKDRYDNAYYEAKSKFDAVNRALLLNENPASVERGLASGYGFLPALGEGLVEGLGGNVSTDEDFKQNFVKGLQEKGVSVTKEQVDAAQLNIGQKVGSAIGNSIPAMAQIALAEIATQGAGTLKAIPEIEKIFKAIEAASEANKAFKYGAIMTEGAVKYGLTPSDDLTAAMGAGEELAQKAFDGMNIAPALAKTKWGKFLAIGARSLGGGLAETAAEYGGEYVDALTKNGYNVEEAFKTAVGRDYDEAKDKLLVTFLTSTLFSGTSNVASALVARNYYEAKGDTQRVEEIDNIAKENGIDLEKAKADFDKKVPTPSESTYTKTQEDLIKTTVEQTGKPKEEVEKQLVEEGKIPDLSKENVPTTETPAGKQETTQTQIQDDQENKQGLPSEVQGGQKPITTEPKQETSGGETAPSGVFQTQGEEKVKENDNYISVYHGGDISDLSDAENNLYVSEDKSQAEAYANGNDGNVKEFKINRNDIANEDEVRQIIVDLGLQSKEEGWDLSSELMLHEILDPRFRTSLNEDDLLLLEKELKNKGYKAIEMSATSMIESKPYAIDILVLNPKETLKDDGGPITKKVGSREADIMFKKGYRPIVNGKVLKDITQSELDNLFENSTEVEMYIKPTPKKVTPETGTAQEALMQQEPTPVVTPKQTTLKTAAEKETSTTEENQKQTENENNRGTKKESPTKDVNDVIADIERRKKEALNRYPELYKKAKTKEELQKVVKDWLGDDVDILSPSGSSVNVRGVLLTPGGFERGKELFLEERASDIYYANKIISDDYDRLIDIERKRQSTAEKPAEKETSTTEENQKQTENENNRGTKKESPTKDFTGNKGKEAEKVRGRGKTPRDKRKIRNEGLKKALASEPKNIRERVLQWFISGGKINTEGFQKLFGDKKTSKWASEARKRINLWDAKKGDTIDGVAHQIWEESGQTLDIQDIRDQVEDVLLSHNVTFSMADEINSANMEEEAIYKSLSEQEQESVDLNEEAEDYWDSLTDEEKEVLVNENILPEDFYKEEKVSPLEKTNTEKAAEAQRMLADKFRKLKIKKPDAGNLFASTPFDLAWDGALEVIAKSLEASASVTEAAGKALEHIKNSDWYKGLTSEQKAKAEQNLKTHIENEMSSFEAEQKPTEEPAKKEETKVSEEPKAGKEKVKESSGFKRVRLNELDPEIKAKLEGVANYKVQDNKEFNDKIIEFVDEVTPEIAIEHAMDMSENLSDGSAIRKKVILYNAGSKMKMKASEKLKNAKKEGDLAAESEAEAELALAYNAILTASKIGTAAGKLNAIDAELHKKYPSLYMIVAMNEFNKNGNEVLDDNTKFKDESGKDITVAEAIEKERVKIEDEIRKEVEKEFNSKIDELNNEIENLKKEKPVDKKNENEKKQEKLKARRKEIIAQLKKSGGVAQATFIPFTSKQIELIGELIANLVQSGGISSKQIINEVIDVVKSFNPGAKKSHIQDIAKSVTEFKEKLSEENVKKQARGIELVKSNLKKQIEILEQEIETKEKVERKRTKYEDQEIKDLKEKRDELKNIRDEIFADETISNEERLKVIEKRLEKSIADYKTKIENIDSEEATEDSGDIEESERIKDLKKERDALRDELKSLRDKKKDGRTPEEKENDRKLKSINEKIEELEGRIARNELIVKKEVKTNTDSKEVQAAKERLKNLREDLAKRKKEYLDSLRDPQQEAVAKKINSLDNQISKAEEILKNGYKKPAKKVDTTKGNPEVEKRKEKLKKLNEDIARIKEDAANFGPQKMDKAYGLTPKKLKEIAMSHLFDRKGVPQTLAKAIIDATKMDINEANAIAENISKSIIDPIIDEVVDRRLLNIIKPTETNANLTEEQIKNKKENRKTANKIKEAIKLGVLSNNEIFQSAFEEKFGFRTLDTITKAKLNNIIEELTKLEADVSKTVSIDGKEVTLDTTQRERILDLQKEFNTILQSSTPLNTAMILSEFNSAIYLSILSNPTSTSLKAFIGSFSGAAFGVFSDAFVKGPIATVAGIAATVKPSNIEASLQRAATALKSGLVEVGKTQQAGEFSSERQSAIENALFNGLSEAIKNKEKGKVLLKSIGIAFKNIRILAAMDAFLVSQTGIYSEAVNGSKAKKGGFADSITPKNQEKVFNDIAEKEYSNIKSDIEEAVDKDIKSGAVENKNREKEIERRLKIRVGSLTSPSSAYKTKRVQELTENQRIDNFKKAWSMAQYFSLIGKPDGLLGMGTSWAQRKMAIRPTDNATDASLKFASQMVFKFVNLMGNMYNATMTSIPVLGLANAFFGVGYDPVKGEYVKGILGKYNANKPLLATRVATNLIITAAVLAALEDQLMWDDEEEKYVLNPDRDFDFRGAGFPGMGGYSKNRRTNENYKEFSFSFTKDKNGKFTDYYSFNQFIPQLNSIVATVSAITDDLKGMDNVLDIQKRQDDPFFGYGKKVMESNMKGFLEGSFNSLGRIAKPFLFEEESTISALGEVATNTIIDNAGALTRPNVVNSVINYIKSAYDIPASKRNTLGEKLATAIYMENFFNQDKTDAFGNPIPQTQDFERFITEIPKQSELYPKTAGLMYKFDKGLEISKWRATEIKGYENFNLKGSSYYSTEDLREEATKIQEQEFNRLVTENYAKLNKMDYEKLNKAVKKYQEKSKEYAKKQLVDKYLDVNNKKSIIKKVEK